MDNEQMNIQIDPVFGAIQRARLLMDVGKWDGALGEIQQALSKSPDSEDAHYLAGLCHYHLSAYAPAKKEAEETLRLDPDYASAYWLLASIALQKETYKAGMKHIDQALELEPEEPLYLSTKAALLLDNNKPEKALEVAEEALRIEPHHEFANHVRAMALSALGRHMEAGYQATDALSRNPDSTLAWYQQGMQLWADGKVEESKEAFLESLRLDPENEGAQEGLMRALAANHPFFALFWRWTLFLYRFSPSTRYAIIFGIWIGMRIFRYTAKAVPALEPAFIGVAIAYILFVIYTWTAGPLFKLAVRKGWIK